MLIDIVNAAPGISTYTLDSKSCPGLRSVKLYLNVVTIEAGGALSGVVSWTDDTGPQSSLVSAPGVAPSYLDATVMIYSIEHSQITLTVNASKLTYNLHAAVA